MDRYGYILIGGICAVLIGGLMLAAVYDSGNNMPVPVNINQGKQAVEKSDNCGSGYKKSNVSKNCVLSNQYCQEELGVGSFWDGNYCNCKKEDGFVWNINNNKCLTRDESCKERKGSFSYSSNAKTDDCGCVAGYGWNSDKTACIKNCAINECRSGSGCISRPANSQCVQGDPNNAWKCSAGYSDKGTWCEEISKTPTCSFGYVLNRTGTLCVTRSQSCAEYYPNTYFDGTYCSCVSGYDWTDPNNRTACAIANNCAYKLNSFWNGSSCQCNSGYQLNTLGQCVVITKTCPANSTLSSDNSCYCNSGYITNDSKTACVVKNNCPANSTLQSDGSCPCNYLYIKYGSACISYNQYCINTTGPASYYMGTLNGVIQCN